MRNKQTRREKIIVVRQLQRDVIFSNYSNLYIFQLETKTPLDETLVLEGLEWPIRKYQG